jgi:hypothetical protein
VIDLRPRLFILFWTFHMFNKIQLSGRKRSTPAPIGGRGSWQKKTAPLPPNFNESQRFAAQRLNEIGCSIDQARGLLLDETPPEGSIIPFYLRLLTVGLPKLPGRVVVRWFADQA